MMPNEAGQSLDSQIKPAPLCLLKSGSERLLLMGMVPGSAVIVNPKAADFRQSFNFEQSGESDGKIFVSSESPIEPLLINQPDDVEKYLGKCQQFLLLSLSQHGRLFLDEKTTRGSVFTVVLPLAPD